jgi:hypothetical protein
MRLALPDCRTRDFHHRVTEKFLGKVETLARRVSESGKPRLYRGTNFPTQAQMRV